MENNQEIFEQKAKAFFADKKNAGINVVHFTSDGNMFRLFHYAESWARGLKDQSITPINRNSKVQEIIDKIISDISDEESSTDSGGKSASEDDERASLINRYIELFDTKPKSAHNIGLDKLRAQIAEKEAELEKDGDPDADGEKHIVTEEDLQNNPDLVEQGVKVGDEITLPEA
ncbi:hypothetical protein [Sphingobacterium sp. LRF_L2]|uniref:hypothetical protein n=1 Tax=Sphingobacterium sp. LRF_L2 TaxID=3369421 RepID=UPI003F5EE90A